MFIILIGYSQKSDAIDKMENSRDSYRKKFSKDETEMIFEYFQHFIENQIAPKKVDVLKFLKEHPLKVINWKDVRNKIKVKVQNEQKREIEKEITRRKQHSKLMKN